jgi:hypothetical protein
MTADSALDAGIGAAVFAGRQDPPLGENPAGRWIHKHLVFGPFLGAGLSLFIGHKLVKGLRHEYRYQDDEPISLR